MEIFCSVVSFIVHLWGGYVNPAFYLFDGSAMDAFKFRSFRFSQRALFLRGRNRCRHALHAGIMGLVSPV